MAKKITLKNKNGVVLCPHTAIEQVQGLQAALDGKLGKTENVDSAKATKVSKASEADPNFALSFYAGQAETSTTPTADKVYVGSRVDPNIISVPKLDGSTSMANYMNLRMSFNSRYFHEIAALPNQLGLYHRMVYGGNALEWKQLAYKDDVDAVNAKIAFKYLGYNLDLNEFYDMENKSGAVYINVPEGENLTNAPDKYGCAVNFGAGVSNFQLFSPAFSNKLYHRNRWWSENNGKWKEWKQLRTIDDKVTTSHIADAAITPAKIQTNIAINGTPSMTVEPTTSSPDKTIASVGLVKKIVDNVQIGGRNLVLNSSTPISSTAYFIGNLPLYENLIENSMYTITIWGELGADRTSFFLYPEWGMGGALCELQQVSNGVYNATFIYHKGNATNSNVVGLYQVPSAGTSTSTIERIKIEKGNKATDWSPAPEDIVNGIKIDTRNLISNGKRLVKGAEETDNYNYITIPIPIGAKVGDTFTFNCGKIENIQGSPTEYDVYLYDIVNNKEVAPIVSITTENRAVTMTAVADAEGGNIAILLYLGKKGSTAGNEVYFYDCTLVKGNKPMLLWQPSVEEVQIKIDAKLPLSGGTLTGGITAPSFKTNLTSGAAEAVMAYPINYAWGTDLNSDTYLKPGMYQMSSASSPANQPDGLTYGALLTTQGFNPGGVPTIGQIYFNQNTNGIVYIRTGTSSNILTRGWKRLTTSEDMEKVFLNSNTGEIPASYIDITDYNKGAADYQSPKSGIYTVKRSGFSDLFVNFNNKAGSTSALEFKARYRPAADSGLYFRTHVDSNRVDGAWQKIATTDDVNTKLPLSGGTLTGTLNMNAYFQLGNSKPITVADTDGVYQTAMYLSSANNLMIGYGTSVVGKRKTILLGNEIEFKSAGNEYYTLKLNSDRTATFASTVTAPTFNGKATSATNADSATKATQDGDGNIITGSYAKRNVYSLGYSKIAKIDFYGQLYNAIIFLRGTNSYRTNALWASGYGAGTTLRTNLRFLYRQDNYQVYCNGGSESATIYIKSNFTEGEDELSIISANGCRPTVTIINTLPQDAQLMSINGNTLATIDDVGTRLPLYGGTLTGDITAPAFETTSYSGQPTRKSKLSPAGLQIYGSTNSGWAGGVTVNDSQGESLGTIAGAYGGSSYSPAYYFYGGTYNNPILKLLPDGRATFKDTVIAPTFDGMATSVKDGSISTSKIVDTSITSEKLAQSLILRGTPQLATQPTLSSESQNIASVGLVKNLKIDTRNLLSNSKEITIDATGITSGTKMLQKKLPISVKVGDVLTFNCEEMIINAGTDQTHAILLYSGGALASVKYISPTSKTATITVTKASPTPYLYMYAGFSDDSAGKSITYKGATLVKGDKPMLLWQPSVEDVEAKIESVKPTIFLQTLQPSATEVKEGDIWIIQ